MKIGLLTEFWNKLKFDMSLKAIDKTGLPKFYKAGVKGFIHRTLNDLNPNNSFSDIANEKD
jgi:hypothetical protein